MIVFGAQNLLTTYSKPNQALLHPSQNLLGTCSKHRKHASRWFWERNSLPNGPETENITNFTSQISPHPPSSFNRWSADDQPILSWNSMLSQQPNLTSNTTQTIYLMFAPRHIWFDKFHTLVIRNLYSNILKPGASLLIHSGITLE